MSKNSSSKIKREMLSTCIVHTCSLLSLLSCHGLIFFNLTRFTSEAFSLAATTGTGYTTTKINTNTNTNTSIRCSNISCLYATSSDDGDQHDNFNAAELSSRINQLKRKESDDLEETLSQRIKELSRSDSIQAEIDIYETSKQDRDSMDDHGSSSSLHLKLPVICFDAVLPNQKIEGRTDDSTFIQFLAELGLGGWFIMTSLDLKSRKVRRNCTLCKIEFLDTVMKPSKKRIPTAVDFVISGQKRCRIAGDDVDMKHRIGRWRRGYDDNGEEVVLGWGEERFLDIPAAYRMASIDSDSDSDGDGERVSASIHASVPSSEWSNTDAECNFDNVNDVTDELMDTAMSLVPLLDEWHGLASNLETYENLNVTCATRIQRDQPFISVQPDNLLRRVKKDLGGMPPIATNSIHDFVYWAAAFINPVPALGVSLEIRGRMLEAYGMSDKLKILEQGLKRSIQNLKGERPL